MPLHIYDRCASYEQNVKFCHLVIWFFSVFECCCSSYCLLADVSAWVVHYQYSHVAQVQKRPHNTHLFCYQLIAAVCTCTRSPVSVSTQTSLSHCSQGKEPELCKLGGG